MEMKTGKIWQRSTQTFMNMQNTRTQTDKLMRKRRDLTQSYDNSPYNNRKFINGKWQNKNATKISITQRSDFELVRLNRFTGSQPSD